MTLILQKPPLESNSLRLNVRHMLLLQCNGRKKKKTSEPLWCQVNLISPSFNGGMTKHFHNEIQTKKKNLSCSWKWPNLIVISNHLFFQPISAEYWLFHRSCSPPWRQQIPLQTKVQHWPLLQYMWMTAAGCLDLGQHYLTLCKSSARNLWSGQCPLTTRRGLLSVCVLKGG